MTGADLFNIINQAAIKAVLSNSKTIKQEFIDLAIDDQSLGIHRKSLVLTEDAKKLTSYHEAGHALVALYSKGAMPLYKATILPRGSALGVTHFTPVSETSVTKQGLFAQIAVALGGRAAEEIIFGMDNVTTGAASDFQSATNIAKKIVSICGMTENLGNVYFEDSDSSISEQTKALIEKEAINIIQNQYIFTKNLLISKRKELEKLANELLVKETLSGDEIKELISWTETLRLNPIPDTTIRK
eukprot:TRINITY_DN4830_c0_g1_i2.p1 TRINITY_DN4830_c0_g1~~TRINITY_DN4830_c0_g1_i2.p1  ORF type:complete len:244 (-),score=121.02 TRINITY_DN4830_c0_g1_i2:18-749(-)